MFGLKLEMLREGVGNQCFVRPREVDFGFGCWPDPNPIDIHYECSDSHPTDKS